MVFCWRKNRCAELNILALQGVPSPAFSDSLWKALAGEKWAHFSPPASIHTKQKN